MNFLAKLYRKLFWKESDFKFCKENTTGAYPTKSFTYKLIHKKSCKELGYAGIEILPDRNIIRVNSIQVYDEFINEGYGRKIIKEIFSDQPLPIYPINISNQNTEANPFWKSMQRELGSEFIVMPDDDTRP